LGPLGATSSLLHIPPSKSFDSPVDVSAREKEVAERLEREREGQQEKHSMSRTSSRTGVDRSLGTRSQTPPATLANPSSRPAPSKAPGPTLAPTVRPTLSFASAAAKRDAVNKKDDDEAGANDSVEQVSDDVSKVAI